MSVKLSKNYNYQLLKGRSTVILNREDYLEKCIDHMNNEPYQLLKKDPTTKTNN